MCQAFSIIRRVWSQPSSICATGCCGKGVPVVIVCVVYEAEGKELLEKYTLDTQGEADRLLELLQSGCPRLAQEKATDGE